MRHPEVVERLYREQQLMVDNLQQRLDRGFHFDNPSCLSCGGESQVYHTDEQHHLVMYRCANPACNRHFTNKDL